MADLNSDEIIDGDILTSYSNPNYAFGIVASRTTDTRYAIDPQDSNGNISVGNQLANGHKSMDDSGDSAISSPATDSALASPNLDDMTAVGHQAGSRYDGLCAKMQRAVQLHQLDELEYSETSGKPDDECRLNPDKDFVDAGLIFAEPNSGNTEVGSDILPPGWQRHEDKDGPYYWHIKSGTIQREVPIASPSAVESCIQKDTLSANQTQQTSHEATLNGTNGSPPAQPNETNPPESREAPSSGEDQEDEANREYEVFNPDIANKYPIRFAVRSLGWVPIAEDQLTQESSSRAVNQCIVKLSSGLRDVNDVVGRWGDGKYLYMDLDQENLSLIDPHDLTVLNVQPIRAIRVWGVGRDSGRDFAYVARDRVSRHHMCHVFRCELPARHIANTLCDICKKIIAQRAAAAAQSSAASLRSRPTDLPNLHQSAAGGDTADRSIRYENLLKNSSFPTPMDEPRKTISCHYLGTLPVTSATGVEILNGAIDSLHSSVPAETWAYVSVTIAPSTITIAEHDVPDNVIAECRVRFLSFLGISLKNVKLCAFIMHTAQDQFVAYVFCCEPSAGALCKTVEAACKLRYQKCLDKSLAMADGLTSPSGAMSCGSTSKDLEIFESSEAELGGQSSEQSSSGGVRASFWVKADTWKTAMSSSLATVKAGTLSTATLLKDSVQEKATNMRSAGLGLSLKDRASSARTGLSTTFDSFKKKTELYFKRES